MNLVIIIITTIARLPPSNNKTSQGKTRCKVFQSSKFLYGLPKKIFSDGKINSKKTANIEAVESETNLLAKKVEAKELIKRHIILC